MIVWFGIIFVICGLALAILVGVALYRDPKQQARSVEETTTARETGGLAFRP